MKVYIIGQKGIPARGGGVERHVEELATRLANSGQEVFVFARKHYTKTNVSKYKNVNIIYTPSIRTKHLEAISHTLLSILMLTKQQVDIVHFHSIGPSLLIPLVRLIKPRAKVIATVHSPDYYHQKWNAFARFCLRLGERIATKYAHATITVSKGLKQHLKLAYNDDAVYIPNGVPLPVDSTDPALLSQWGLTSGNYIVSISRLIRHKGLHFLIEAYTMLGTDKKLVIVGDGAYTDDYQKELRLRAKGNPNIIFTGKQTGTTLQALYEHAYIFVQPSLSEGLSIALLEALSHSQTVLASDIPENLEVINNIGFSFKSADVKDLALKMQFLLDHPEIVKQYKELGRQHVTQYYNWETITKNTISVYESVIPGKRKVPIFGKQAKQVR